MQPQKQKATISTTTTCTTQQATPQPSKHKTKLSAGRSVELIFEHTYVINIKKSIIIITQIHNDAIFHKLKHISRSAHFMCKSFNYVS